MLDRRRSAPTLSRARPVGAELIGISPQIEHRLFSFISINWRGKPLTDIRTIVELIGATTTTTGLTVLAAYDPNWYPTGQRVSDADFATIPLRPHDWHGEWNYDITTA